MAERQVPASAHGRAAPKLGCLSSLACLCPKLLGVRAFVRAVAPRIIHDVCTDPIFWATNLTTCVQLHDTLVGRGHITDQRGVRAYWCAGPCSCVWLGTDACAASCRVVPTRAASRDPQEGAPGPDVALVRSPPGPGKNATISRKIAGCFAGADSSHWPPFL